MSCGLWSRRCCRRGRSGLRGRGRCRTGSASRASCSSCCNDIAWQLLPLELGFGSGQTCWRRLERWQKAGVFDQLHQILLAELNAAGELDWSRAGVDGSHIRAKKGAPTPVRRRSTGGRRAASTT
ncbi:transposase [Streptomyces microflavus]